MPDRFAIEGRAGGGGMGDVYRALDQETGRTVAIKLLRGTSAEVERSRFAREIKVIAELRHPNIVEYIAHGTWGDGRMFYAMEWLDGEDVSQRQKRAPLGMRDAVEVVRRSAAAMAAIHARGVVHRDLKLANIFLGRGAGTHIKLIDFGVVRLPPLGDPMGLAPPEGYEDEPDERGAIIGTPHFMAPEQARGEPVDARADVYSLGSVLFRLVTGKNVFETEHIIALLGRLVIEDPPSPASLRFDVPELLEQVILRALARRKDERFEDGGELARALARVGTLNNDPPATDQSASAIRRTAHQMRLAREVGASDRGSALPPPPATSKGASTSSPPRRPQTGHTGLTGTGAQGMRATAERRVVAAVLFDGLQSPMSLDLEEDLRKTLADDARLEPLYSGQLVAIFGVERSRGDEALRAARAALLVAQGHAGARAVVAVGHAIRGRMNLAGEALDRAAKQLELTHPGTVRVDSHVLPALEGRFVVHQDTEGGVLLREDPTSFTARLLLGRSSQTVGRDKEIALLSGVFRELASEGTPRAAIVTGPAGVGKSRVRAELVSLLETSPAEVTVCRGDPMGHGSLSCLGRALRLRMGVHDGEAPESQVQKVRTYLNLRLPRPVRFLAGFLGELVGVAFPDGGDEALRSARGSASIMQARMRMALEAFVRSQADTMPQVFVLEDAQWADDATLDLVDTLLGCRDLKFGAFVFARPEIDQRPPGLWANKNVTRLALPPLSPAAAEKLVGAALPRAEPALRTSIVERAGGNALFLEELVRAAAEGRDELPLTVHALVQMRLDRRSTSAREVVRAGSIFGQTFWSGGIEALLGRDIEADIEEIEQAELVARQSGSRVQGEVEYAFRQALVREAAYASLLEEDRTSLHLSAAAWLESIGDVDLGVIARHAELGGDRIRAARLYARATRQAMTSGAPLPTALELAERGMACGAEGVLRAELLVAAALVHQPLGRLEDAVLAADEAQELALPGSETWGEAARLAASALIERGDAMMGDMRAMIALAQPGQNLSPGVRASLLAVRVRGLVDLGKPHEALQVAEEALEIARTAGSASALVHALDGRMFALMQLADPSEVVRVGPETIQGAESGGDIILASRARINTASSMNTIGMCDEATPLLERALADARERRMRILEGFALHNLGMARARLGRFDDGIDMQRQAADIADEARAARLRINARVYEAIIATWRGAQGDLAAALNISEALSGDVASMPALAPTAAFLAAHVHLSIGRNLQEPASRQPVEHAVEHALEFERLVAKKPVEEWEELARLTLFDGLVRLGRTAEADRALRLAFDRVVERARHMRLVPHRAAYLERVPEVRATVDLARQRLGLALPSFGAPPLPPKR